MSKMYMQVQPAGHTLTKCFCEEVTLRALQQAVGGYIEAAPLEHPRSGYLIVNEEGRLRNLPKNVAASCYAGYDIFGDAVLLTGKHADEFASREL